MQESSRSKTRSTHRSLLLAIVLPLVLFRSAGIVAAQLVPGTFLATTDAFGATVLPSNGNGIFVVDPFAKTSTRLAIPGFPVQKMGAGSGKVLVLNRSRFLVTMPGNAQGGDLWDVTWTGSSWQANVLNTSPIPIVPGEVAQVGSTLYILTSDASNGPTCTCAKIYRMPIGGGAPTLYLDLAAQGVTGYGNAMAVVGSSLHVFTFDTTPSPTSTSGHWEVDTSALLPTVKKHAAMPRSIRMTNTNFKKFAAVGAEYDTRSGHLIILSRWGDVLWRDLNGNDIAHRKLPGTVNGGGGFTRYANALSLNTDMGTVIIGDLAGNYEEWRDPAGKYHADFLNIVSPSNPMWPWVQELAYVPSDSRYFTIGPGCKDSRGEVPASYANSLPNAPNPTFAFTLDSKASTAVLAIGATKANFNLTALGMPGCFAHLNPFHIIGVTAGPGGIHHSFALPSGLKGVNVITQWLAMDPSANAFGAVVSDARQLEIW